MNFSCEEQVQATPFILRSIPGFSRRQVWNWSQEQQWTCVHSFFVGNPLFACNTWLTFSSSRLLARCVRDEVRTNVDIHTLVWESSIMKQDIRDILISFDSRLIYQMCPRTSRQAENRLRETNVPRTLSVSSCLPLSRRGCKPGIKNMQKIHGARTHGHNSITDASRGNF